MATAADVDLTEWVRQLESPFYDGNNPSVLRNPTSAYFFGYPYVSISSITIPSIEVASTSTEAPMALFASASNVSATGTRTETSNAVNPYQDIEYRWTVTKNDDSAVEDVEGLTDPRTGNSFNPYTDQISPEFTCVLREPGTYKLKLTARGMSSTFGTVIEQTRTETITVVASTLSKTWYDGTGGDDANDGLDPWGFGLTTASYTHSTRELTQSGAFASYVHDVSATKTRRDNYIYIDKAGFEGLYEIESKSSNDTIILATGLGSDQTSVTSSDGPKKTYSGGANSGVEVMLKGGNTYDITSSIPITTAASSAVTAYGGDATITNSSGGDIVGLTSNTSSTPDYYRITGCIVDGQGGEATAVSRVMRAYASNVVQTTPTTVIIDNSEIKNGTQENEVQVEVRASTIPFHYLFYKTTVDGRYGSTGRSSSRQGLFTDMKSGDYMRAMCMTIHNDADNAILDHFWYPSGDPSHFHFAYSETAEGTGNNFALNLNTKETESNYVSINNCKFSSNSQWVADASDISNTSNSLGFSDVWVVNNLSNVYGGMFFQYSLWDAYVAYNQAWGGSSVQGLFVQASGTGYSETLFDLVLYNNQVYGQKLIRSDYGADAEVFDNVAWQTTDDEVFEYTSSAFSSTTMYADGNNLYAPNKTGGNQIDDGGSAISLSSFNTAVGGANISTLPSWPSPSTGNFGGVATGIEVNL